MEKFDDTTHCRVCGFKEQKRWERHEDGELTANYFICPCCRAESGPDDYDLETVKASRKEWLDNGMKWWDEDETPPENWNAEEQMKVIPEKWLQFYRFAYD